MEAFALKIKQILWGIQGNIWKIFKKLENNQQRPLLHFYFLWQPTKHFMMDYVFVF